MTSEAENGRVVIGRGQTPFERVTMHVVQGLTVAGIVGGYMAFSNLQASTAVMQTKIEHLTVRIDDFRQLADDRYTSTQATRDIKPIIDRLVDHESRLRVLEKEVSSSSQ